MQRKNVYTFNQIARQNLMRIAGDQTLGGTNAGWCYLFAPLRSYLTNPDFLQALYQYKQNLENELLTFLGINNVPIEKKERLMKMGVKNDG